MSKEAMKLALARLQARTDTADLDAIAALNEALAEQPEQPEQQEPVAWMSPSWIDPDTRGWQSDSFESIPIEGWLPIYTSPPTQRTWVGLTDEEVDNFLKAVWGREVTPKHFIQAIEAKLKEKNT